MRRHRAARGARATTSTSPSARATCRPRRCRWPSPTRRSPTAARSCARTSAARSRTARAALQQKLRAPAAPQARHLRDDAVDDHGGPAAAATAPGGTSTPTSSRAPTSTVYGKTGTAERGTDADQSWYVAYVPHRVAPDRGRGRPSRRAASARRPRRPPRALILSDLVRSRTRTRARRAITTNSMSPTTPITPASEPPPPLVPREIRLRIDPLLLLAALGLVVCSVIAHQGRHRATTSTATPHYYVYRQIAFGGDRLRADVRLLAAGLLAAARAALPALRLHDRLDRGRLRARARRPRAPSAGSRRRSSTSSRPSWARSCSSSRVSAFLVDRMRGVPGPARRRRG